MSSLIVSREDAVLHVLLNRPSHGNAINRTMALELLDVVTAVRSDDSLAAVIIEGAGPFFCTGGDVKEYAGLTRHELEAQFSRMRTVCDILENLPIPSVAAIAGAAVGGGLELALACDIRFVSPDSWLQFPNLQLGVITAWDGGRRLAQLVGTSRAREIVYTARRIDPVEAASFGLATAVSDSPRAAAMEFVRQVAKAPMPALRRVKDAVRTNAQSPSDGSPGVTDPVLDLWFSVGTIRQNRGREHQEEESEA